MSATNGKKKQGGFLKKLSLVLTSLAAIATSVAAFLGVVVHDKTAQLQHATAQASSQSVRVSIQQRQITQLNVQINQQKQTIQQLRAAPPTASPATAGSDTGGGAALSGGVHYLSNENPTVDNSILDTGQRVISAKQYVNSVVWECGGSTPNEAYDVAGSSVLTAEVGIPDNMQGATNVIATVTFSNEAGQQIGKPVQVSLGHPVSLRLDIGGVTQLGMSCAGRNRQTSQPSDNFSVALGDAGVS